MSTKQDPASQRTSFIMMFFAFAFGMILSNLLNTQSQTKQSEIAEETLFIYRGIEKTVQDIPNADAKNLAALEREKLTLLENIALHYFFLDQSLKLDTPIEQLTANLLNLAPVSDAEVNAFYRQHQDKINQPFYDVRAEIKKHLEHQRIKGAREQLLVSLKEKGDLVVLPNVRHHDEIL